MERISDKEIIKNLARGAEQRTNGILPVRGISWKCTEQQQYWTRIVKSIKSWRIEINKPRLVG